MTLGGGVSIAIVDLSEMRYVYVTDPYLAEWVFTESLKQEAVAVDVETTMRRDLPPDLDFDPSVFPPGLDPYLSEIRLLQIGFENCVYVIDCWHCGNVIMFGELMRSENVLKIGHNLKFDMKMMMREWGFRFRRIYDTMLASQLLTNGKLSSRREHSLEAATRRYLDIAIDKSEQKSNWGAEVLSEEQIHYAAMDVAILFPLAREQSRNMKDKKAGLNLNRAAKIEFDCCIATAKLELDGIYVDPDIWNEADLSIRAVYMDIASRLKEALGSADINLDSPKQILKALNELGIDLDGTDSKKDLGPLKDKYPVITLLLEYRGLAKALSSYGNGIPGKKRKKGQVYFLERVHPITGRIHSDFGQLYTATGRFNSSKPNVQQIPNTNKGTFRYACTGQVVNGEKNFYIVADWSQFEMRILAYFSKDQNLMDAFSLGDDIHSSTASLMFNVPVESIVYKDEEGKKIEGPNYWMRNAAKSINFGLVYGRGIKSLAAQIGVTEKKAAELMEQYFKTFSGAGTWLERAAYHGLRTSQQNTISGRVRYFKFDPLSRIQRSSVERESKNTPIQGSNADMLKVAMYRLVVALEELGWDKEVKLVNVIHDEINLEAPPYLAEKVCDLTKNIMEEVGSTYLYPVPVSADAGYGLDWTIK